MNRRLLTASLLLTALGAALGSAQTAAAPAEKVQAMDGKAAFEKLIRFLDDGRLEASWTFFGGGKSKGANHFFALTREN